MPSLDTLDDTVACEAWSEGWWEMGRTVGDLLAPIIGAAPGSDLDAPERERGAGHHRLVLQVRRAAAEDRR